jgi:hypothetical protein
MKILSKKELNFLMRNLCSTFLFGRYSRLRFPLPEAKATTKAFRESSTYAGAQRRVFFTKNDTDKKSFQ